MCGLVGAVGDLEYRDKDAVQLLMHLCEIRGEDSTGYFTVGKSERETRTHKVVGPTRTMFDTLGWDKLRLSDEKVFSGHCRKATVGLVNRRTAHPFTYDHITGVHNGTLKNWRWLLQNEEATDSMTLYRSMAEKGVKETIEATDGAYALVWWDENEETINFLRNSERPLYYAFSEDYKKMFWASEAWMLHIALSRCGIKLADLTPKDKTIETVLPIEENTWWRLRIGGRSDKDKLTFLSDHEENLKGGVNPAKYVAAPFQGQYRAPFPVVSQPANPQYPVKTAADYAKESKIVPDTTKAADGSTTTNTSTSPTPTKESDSQKKDSRVCRTTLSLVQSSKSGGSGVSTSASSSKGRPDLVMVNGNPVVIGFNGITFEKAEYETWVKPNCLWCQTPVSFEEAIEDPTLIAEWASDEEFICGKCVNDGDITRAMICC